MVSQTNEREFEATIEQALTGVCREALQPDSRAGSGSEATLSLQASAQYQSEVGLGYRLGWPEDYDRDYAVDKQCFWGFLEATQPEQLAKLSDQSNWRQLVLERLSNSIRKQGIIKVLKSGLSINDAHLTLMYSAPYNDINPEIAANFERNIFSLTRQLYYSATDTQLSLDMVLFINGLPIATIELKNAWTGQQAWQAREQYRNTRDPKELLFQFGRCLVHFAVDTDEVYMTTKLDGKKTVFLPFNKGHHFGKGNPPNPNGHRSAYLWQEILGRHSLANIIQHFAKLVEEKDEKTKKVKKTLYFPRFHQLEVVRKLLQHVAENGVGQTYLIQHSAGSGKSNSITWAAYQLIEAYRPGSQHPMFDSVIVVTDRRVLDKQLRNNIRLFSDMKNIVAPAMSSQDLKTALESGKKVIITTIQKFPFIVDGIDDLSNKNFAVIIDEAHSSQSGSAADNLNKSLGDDAHSSDGEDEIQDQILEIMRRRKMRGNASYFAFTATPKNATLERFGQQTADGKFVPFHLYSMKQAIEEGFILDVLANYTTYQSYYEIEKSIADNPVFETAKAQKKLRAYVEGHKQTIAVKAEIMVNHFLEQVVAPKKLKGKAKGMVVTRNIEAAIRYFHAIRDVLQAKGVNFKALIAFSGKKTVDGIEYTEEIINGFASQGIEDAFKTDEYRLLVVANKYLTGFDQPQLSTMYVDKKLQGVLAVQALSRLNRCNHGLGKRTEDMFVLDFFNSTDDIKTAFDPFYTSTTLSGATDVNVLHDLKDQLDDVGLYDWHEVDDFNRLFFSNVPGEQLSPIIETCVERFEHELELDDNDQVTFKVRAKQFVKIYAQLACIMSFQNLEWEKLYWFLKFLIPKLKIQDTNQEDMDQLLESVDLSTYSLARTHLKEAIGLDDSETEVDPQNPNPRNPGGDEVQRDPLDEIIRVFNERWFQNWEATPEEKKIKLVNLVEHVMNDASFESQVFNNPDAQNSDMAIRRMTKDAINKERRKDLDLYRNFAQDDDFRSTIEAAVIAVVSQRMAAMRPKRPPEP